ncbi:hypothetical protein ACH4NI_35605 [Streptomyces olivaceus]|uniref:hypothetical protein n=1 Tax=Streptomyces olivaceus TaxID=47716 RepID=UPI0037B3DC87
MTNTPTRRPTTPTSQRRPSKGHRPMARYSYDKRIASHVVAAADKLRADDPVLAESLDKISAPGGWQLLRPPAPAGGRPNLAIWTPVSVRTQLMDASPDLAADVDEGFAAYLAGRFTPDKPPRGRLSQGATEDRKNLNVRPDPHLVQQINDSADARAEELGWKPTPGVIALAWLRHKYGL